jgi:SAM-dependent methyltransferase
LHQHAAEYLISHIGKHLSKGDYVVEFGSYNVNGTVRDWTEKAGIHYGIDMRDGPGVNHVMRAEEFDGQEGFDMVICAETLEHADKPSEVIQAAHRSLKPGGVLVLTAAAPEREPHNNNGDHGEEALAGEHYGGIAPEDLRSWLADWEVLNLEHHPDYGDVRAVARKK